MPLLLVVELSMAVELVLMVIQLLTVVVEESVIEALINAVEVVLPMAAALTHA